MSKSFRRRFAGVWLIAAAMAGGCDSPTWTRRIEPGGDTWAVATGLARAADPAVAAEQAAWAAQARLGPHQAGAVLFFECFGHVDAPDRVAAAVRTVFPRAEIIGCSASGVLTQDGASGDRAVAVLAISADRRFASARVDAAAGSGRAAGEMLARQFGGADGGAAFVLTTAATVAQPGWDANELASAMASRTQGAPVIFGGVTSTSAADGPPRLYHGDRSFAEGVVVLRVGGPILWAADARHEWLRVGPVWRAGLVRERRVGQLASGRRVLPAEAALRALLIAQEWADPHVAWLVGQREAVLPVRPLPDGAVELPVRVQDDDRLVALKAGTAAGRINALRRALAGATRSDRPDEPLATLVVLPSGPASACVQELDDLGRELAGPAAGRPAAIGFLGVGLFSPQAGASGQPASLYCQNTTGVFRFGLTEDRSWGAPPAVTQPD